MTTSTQVYIEHHDGKWRCIRTPDGRTPVRVGCSHLSPAHASAHAKAMAVAMGTTPLRDPAVELTPLRVSPLIEAGPLGSTAGLPRGESPVRITGS